MLEKELETAIALARLAGARILEFYALEIIAEQKLGVDNLSEPVTIADRTASRIIVEGLAEIFPADAILSEEEADDIENRVSGKRVWMIDPIDGTQGFINKDGDFGVQIGLTDHGEAVLGVVLLPFHNELFYAVKNGGAFLAKNDEPPKHLQVSGKTDFSQMTLAVSRNHLSPKMSRVSENFNIGNVIHRGSVGLKIGLIARQTADLYIHLSPRTKFWDSCAPQIILEEAGGKMTDIFGAPLHYDLHNVQNHNGILASNGAAHDLTVEKLRALLNEFGRLKVTKADL
ncbi:MAG: 3'(2'),5'-bisphosphate nucleotidase CysQ [Actinomycetota bacterium]